MKEVFNVIQVEREVIKWGQRRLGKKCMRKGLN